MIRSLSILGIFDFSSFSFCLSFLYNPYWKNQIQKFSKFSSHVIVYQMKEEGVIRSMIWLIRTSDGFFQRFHTSNFWPKFLLGSDPTDQDKNFSIFAFTDSISFGRDECKQSDCRTQTILSLANLEIFSFSKFSLSDDPLLKIQPKRFLKF